MVGGPFGLNPHADPARRAVETNAGAPPMLTEQGLSDIQRSNELFRAEPGAVAWIDPTLLDPTLLLDQAEKDSLYYVDPAKVFSNYKTRASTVHLETSPEATNNNKVRGLVARQDAFTSALTTENHFHRTSETGVDSSYQSGRSSSSNSRDPLAIDFLNHDHQLAPGHSVNIAIVSDHQRAYTSIMAENAPPPAAPAGSGGATTEPFDRAKEMAEYEKEKQLVKEFLNKRNKHLSSLTQLEARIVDLENKYLESTPSGNILTGFDNYTKGLTGAAAQRRKAGTAEQNRVFSRSSVSYNALNPEATTPGSGTSTPGAPTPLSTSFANKEKAAAASDAPTPTSATEKKTAAGKKKKEKAVAAAAEDSETDSREVKKARTHFGANARK
ncbi:histone acetyltransferase subunit NuA4-domain-containing protein [Xylariales sp. PMI_506]|nr:histone acetyltransferase subunit NuA4-domain-containing protein [Xylariales sp. PMI_506]